jgi:hypothetical protein
MVSVIVVAEKNNLRLSRIQPCSIATWPESSWKTSTWCCYLGCMPSATSAALYWSGDKITTSVSSVEPSVTALTSYFSTSLHLTSVCVSSAGEFLNRVINSIYALCQIQVQPMSITQWVVTLTSYLEIWSASVDLGINTLPVEDFNWKLAWLWHKLKGNWIANPCYLKERPPVMLGRRDDQLSMSETGPNLVNWSDPLNGGR